jgi:hypothetical protein
MLDLPWRGHVSGTGNRRMLPFVRWKIGMRVWRRLLSMLRRVGRLTSGSTRAKRIRGEDEDRGQATLEEIERVERTVPARSDREAGTPEAEAER